MATAIGIPLDRCGRCGETLPLDALNRHELGECPACRGNVGRWVFPRLLREEGPSGTGEAAAAGEGTCYYHPDKRAEVPCDNCGRFLCALCHIDLAGQALCPTCVEAGAAKDAAGQRTSEYVHYDTVALYTAALPMVLIFFFWLIPFTALATLYLCVRHWRTPLSVLPRSRWRFVLAGGLALMQLAGTVLLLSGFLDAVFTAGAAIE
jgi:hypothetical protein